MARVYTKTQWRIASVGVLSASAIWSNWYTKRLRGNREGFYRDVQLVQRFQGQIAVGRE